MVALVAHAAPASAQTALAEQRYARGTEHYRAGRFAEALAEFRASLALRASPNTRLMQARCLRNVGQLVDAALEYDRATRDGRESPQYAQTVSVAERERALVLEQLTRVHLEFSEPDDAVELEVDRIRTNLLSGRELLVTPGDHELRARVRGRLVQQRIAARAGESLSVRLTWDESSRERAATPSPTIRSARATTSPESGRSASAFWVAGATTGALSLVGWGTFAIAAVQSEQLFRSLDQQCAAACPGDLERSIARGRELDAIGNVGFVAAVTLLATSASLLLAGGVRARAARVNVSVGAVGVRF